MPEGENDQQRRQRLADDDDEADRDHGPEVAEDDGRIEQHADRDEEQHREGVAQRQGFLGGAMAQLRFGQDHPGEERAERKGYVEELRRAVGNAQRDREHGQPKQLLRTRMGDVMEEPGDHPAPDHEHDRHEGRHLAEGDGKRPQQFFGAHGHGHTVGLIAQEAGHGRQQDEGEHHRQILDNQPADGDAPALGLDQPAFLKRAEEHDRTGDRKRQTEDETRPHRPAHQPRHAEPEEGRDGDLRDRPRNGDRLDRQKVLQREVQPHAEHQKNDADFGQLRRQREIRHESRGRRSDNDAGQEIPDQRRDSQPIRNRPEHEGKDQADDDGGDERRMMRHGRQTTSSGR